MKTYICFAAAVILTFACSTEPPPVTPDEPAGTGIETDTLVITDSIGVLMGDSCYMIGTIAKAEALSDGRVILLDGTRGTTIKNNRKVDFPQSHDLITRDRCQEPDPITSFFCSSNLDIVLMDIEAAKRKNIANHPSG